MTSPITPRLEKQGADMASREAVLREQVSRPDSPHSAGSCDCIGEIDAKLKPLGHALTTTLFGDPKVCIESYRERKGAPRAPRVIASFCPFCGRKYDLAIPFSRVVEEA